MSLAAGARLGPYEVLGLLGAGGMGEVYKATDTRLGRTVAIKVLPPAVAADPERRARFEREAKTIAALNHPHICALYDVGRHGDTDFLVMEHVAGEPLAALLERGPVPLPQALTIAVEIADALAAAHRQGVVHRDLKPGNVMLTRSGAKLLDFGLAKLRADADVASATALTTAAPITEAGMVLGTAPYMSPEQLQGREIDARSDIFSFGTVLYEMVTGARAFEGDSHASVIAAILDRQPPPLSSRQPVAPPALDRVVRACLAKDPDERAQSVADVRRELAWILEEQGTLQAPGAPGSAPAGTAGALGPAARRRGARWRLAALAFGALALVLSLALVWMQMPTAPQPLAPLGRFRIDPPPGYGLATGDGAAAIALSPDGRLLAFAAYDLSVVGRSTHPDPIAVGPAVRLFVRPIDDLQARVLEGTTHALRPFFSADSRWLGFWQDGKIRKIAVGGGPVIALTDAPQMWGACWTADNDIIYGDGGGLMRVAADANSRPIRVATGAPGSDIRDPFLLPGGRTLLATTGPAGSRSWGWENDQVAEIALALVSLSSGAITPLGIKGHHPRFLPPGLLVYAGPDEWLHAIPFDPVRGAIAGTGEPVLRTLRGRLTTASPGMVAYLQYTGIDSSELALVSRDGKASRIQGNWAAAFAAPRVSPDGRSLAAHVDQVGVWVSPLPEGPVTWISRGREFRPAWHPNGKAVLFHDGPEVRQRDAAAARDAQLLLQDPRQIAESLWSPDGRWLVYRTYNGEVFARDAAGNTEPVNLAATPATEVSPAVSPDGRWLAYASNESGQQEVYVQAFGPSRETRVRISSDRGTEPMWSRNGRELFYRDRRMDLIAVDVKTTAGSFSPGAQHRLFSTAPYKADGFHAAYDVLPDGRFVMIRDQRVENTELILIQDFAKTVRTGGSRR